MTDHANTDQNFNESGGDYPSYLDHGGQLDRDAWEAAGYPPRPPVVKDNTIADKLGIDVNDFPARKFFDEHFVVIPVGFSK